MNVRELEKLFAESLVRNPGDVAGAVGADHDGVRLASLLVVKLRFERLLRGSDEADREFESDPAGFTQLFERYVNEVPPTAFFPAGEAKLFREWRLAVSRRE